MISFHIARALFLELNSKGFVKEKFNLKRMLHVAFDKHSKVTSS